MTIVINNFSSKFVFFVCLSLLIYFSLPRIPFAETVIPTKHIKLLFTIKGDINNPLSLPSDVSVDKNGDIYIVDSGNNRVAVFNSSGENIDIVSSKGKKISQLNNPVGIDVDEYNIYVADKDNHRIQVFNKNGKVRKNIILKKNGLLIRPVDIAFNNDLNIFYITGNNNHKIMAYDYSGKYLFQWGGEGTNKGEFRYPATISIHNNNIYVVDVLNSRVQIFNAKGQLQTIAGEWGVLPGQLFRPKGVALDKKGNIYVSDSYMGVIQVFSSDTRFRYVLAHNKKPVKFTSPAGIAVDNNLLYVCEMLKNKVSVYSLGR